MLGAVQMFEAAGFEALVAFTSDEAMAHLEGRAGVVAIFCDYEAPGTLDGDVLARTVRGRWPTVEIMVVSKPRSAPPPGLPLGARYFEKPYSLAEVKEALEALGLMGGLPRARSTPSSRA